MNSDERLKVAKVDVDRNPVLRRQFEVRRTPPVLFKGGKVTKRLVGHLPKAALMSELDAGLVG